MAEGWDMTDRQAHWDAAYTTKDDTQVSWYEPVPARSLALIRSAAGGTPASAIDIGGGASRLADALLADGCTDVAVLDISAVALSRSRVRLGDKGRSISWIVADVTQWYPERAWAVWHDRAVFHFLTDTDAQDKYIAALKHGTIQGASIVMATFALDGPERCSALPVQRYSAATLADRLGEDFVLYGAAAETHPTPFGTFQEFTYAAFHRR